MSGGRRGQGGFTLLEVMVALAIFGLVAIMAYGGLRTVLDARAHTDAMADRLTQLQKAMSILARDIEQAVPRGIRDEYGDLQPALYSGGLGIRLELTRTGLRNPTGVVRSALQRVAYAVEEGELVRSTWRELDRGPEPQVFREPLLDRVRDLELRFLGEDNQWQGDWPPLTVEEGPPRLPRAVEVTLELEDWGRITRLFGVVP